MCARVLTVIPGGSRPTPAYVDVSVRHGLPSFVVAGVRLHDVADVAALLRTAFAASDIAWPIAAVRAQVLPWHGCNLPDAVTLALAAGILVAQAGPSGEFGVLGTLERDGRVTGRPSQAAIALALGHCDRVLIPGAVGSGHPAITHVSTLAEALDALTRTNGPP